MTFQIGDVEIELKRSFFFLLTFFLICDPMGFGIYAFLSCVIHEMGHLILLFVFHQHPKRVVAEAFGIRIEKNTRFLSYRQEAMMLLAGPLTNLLAFGILYSVGAYTGQYGVMLVSVVNFVLGLFNLLPIVPLDGGRVLNLLLRQGLSVTAADRATILIGVLFLLPLMTGAFFLVVHSGYNITLLITCAYLCLLMLRQK